MCAYTVIKLLHGIFKNIFIPYSFVKADSVVIQFSVINWYKDRLSFWKCSITRSMWGPRNMFPGEGSFISADDSSGRMTVNWPTWLWMWKQDTELSDTKENGKIQWFLWVPVFIFLTMKMKIPVSLGLNSQKALPHFQLNFCFSFKHHFLVFEKKMFN